MLYAFGRSVLGAVGSFVCAYWAMFFPSVPYSSHGFRCLCVAFAIPSGIMAWFRLERLYALKLLRSAKFS